MDDMKTVGAIVAAAASVGNSAIEVATITSIAPGILGAIGLTTTTTVALPIAAIIGVGGLLGYGIWKGIQHAQRE
jgi:hypothetical protein